MLNIRIFEKRPGAWHLDLRLEGGRRVRPFAGATRAEAERAAPMVIARALAEPQPSRAPDAPAKATPPQGGLTVDQAFRKALRERQRWVQAKDRKGIEDLYASLGLPPDMPCAELTKARVTELRGQWLREPGKRKGTTLTPSTINHRLSMLSTLLETAELPPHGVKHLSVKGNRRMRRISPAEVERMLAWADGHASRRGADEFRVLIELALETAARQGELLGLEWRDVDLEAGTLAFRDTKNYETRIIPLTDRAASLLRARRALPRPFPTLDKDRVVALWQDMRFALGLATDEEFVFHTLRHEAISRLVDQGVDAFTIAAIAGHASITTTQVYAKASLAGMRRALCRTLPEKQPMQFADGPTVNP